MSDDGRPFGRYLLFKRLDRDPLGSTFRARRLDSGAASDPVLLRTFAGTGLEADPEWSAALLNPHLAEPVEVGSISGQIYLAYDHRPGVSLGTLLSLPLAVPAPHAQAICARVARGLAAALAHTPSSPLFHGVLLPELVWLSPDGGVRVLGLELAAGIRGQLAGGGPHSPYWSPELLAGEPAAPSDDVYTLGALLFELLTGRKPPQTAEAWQEEIETALLSTSGEPLPEGARSLLGRSLAARADRLSDVKAWRDDLDRWLADEPSTSSTFDLAFFLSTSLDRRLESDTAEIELERRSEAPAAPPATPSPASTRKATLLRWVRVVATIAAAAALTFLAIRLYLDVAQGPALVQPRLTVPPTVIALPDSANLATVRVRVLVGADGRARRVEPVDPTTPGDLVQAAEGALQEARWTPATTDGQPVDHWVELSVEIAALAQPN